MFIPLEGENIVCLANVSALIRDGGRTFILKSSGERLTSSFTPQALARRRRAFADSALWRRSAPRTENAN